MMSRRVWLISVAAIMLFSLLPQPVSAASLQVNVSPQAAGYTTHVVQAGESLSSIPFRDGVTVQALVTANNTANANHIYVGQLIRIPTTGQQSTPSQPSTCTQPHTVVAGQTPSSLPIHYGALIQGLAPDTGVRDVCPDYFEPEPWQDACHRHGTEAQVERFREFLDTVQADDFGC